MNINNMVIDESDSLATRKLFASSNPLRRLIALIIAEHQNTTVEKLKGHLEIDHDALMYHIKILKDAQLISNKTVDFDGVTMALYNIKPGAKEYLENLEVCSF